LKDIQNQRDHRNLDVDRVGIKDLSYPVVLSDRNRGKQNTVARIYMYVRLPHDF
jgi:GTP cyclohydrolase I